MLNQDLIDKEIRNKKAQLRNLGALYGRGGSCGIKLYTLSSEGIDMTLQLRPLSLSSDLV